jgi:hypothetical protein
MTLIVIVALLVIVAVVFALAARLFRQPARDAVAVAPRIALDEEIATMPSDDSPTPEPALHEPEPEPVITWTEVLTPAPLDETARLRLIDDLTLLAAPWTIELLRRAYEEEASPQLRARIESALASSIVV